MPLKAVSKSKKAVITDKFIMIIVNVEPLFCEVLATGNEEKVISAAILDAYTRLYQSQSKEMPIKEMALALRKELQYSAGSGHFYFMRRKQCMKGDIRKIVREMLQEDYLDSLEDPEGTPVKRNGKIVKPEVTKSISKQKGLESEDLDPEEDLESFEEAPRPKAKAKAKASEKDSEEES